MRSWGDLAFNILRGDFPTTGNSAKRDEAESGWRSVENSFCCSIERNRSSCWRASNSCLSKSCTCLDRSEKFDSRSENTYLIDDIRRFVSLVNWQRTLRLEHSVQLVVSVASHLGSQYTSNGARLIHKLTLTLRSRQASQLGSFLLCLYALFGLCIIMAEIWAGEGVPLPPPLGRKFSPK